MKTIQLTDEQYNALMQGEAVTIEPPKPKIEKWQPKGGEWFVNSVGHVMSLSTMWLAREFGTVYQTEEQAVKARDAMRTHNRLLAWLAENDDGWVADWNDVHQSKYYIYSVSNSEGRKYSFSFDWDYRDLTRIYMSLENSKKLCDLLNEGVVEL